jgi:cation diffusion facilitator CzcD-associated flavoprotein CzcO
MTTRQAAQSGALRTIIIGAGMAGLLAGIRLKQRGESEFTIYEKGDCVGGTWRENTYPGLTCDVPAHAYTYSFAYNPDWSAFMAPGPEIREYFEAMANRFGVMEHIRFDEEVESCAWQDGKWQVRTSKGREDAANMIVAATGVLHVPNYPDIAGIGDFAGACFHSARWDHAVPLDGKRIGVIGTGSTGVQIVSALADRAAQLTHFQRTAQWIMARPGVTYSEQDKAAFRADPALIEAVRNNPEGAANRERFLRAVIDPSSPAHAELEALLTAQLEQRVADPVLREKLRPTYRAACKRLIFANDYYDAVQKPNVTVETGKIARVGAEGVRLEDGSLIALDVLVLATGFQADQFVRPMRITGLGGADLEELWADVPRAYFAVTVPNFPNLVLLNGPAGPVGNFSLIDVAEAQWAYFDKLMEPVRRGECAGLAPTMAALDSYDARRREAAAKTIWASGCQSWYIGGDGLPQVWSWPMEYFWEVMAQLISATTSGLASPNPPERAALAGQACGAVQQRL